MSIVIDTVNIVPAFLDSEDIERENLNLLEYWRRMHNNYYVHLKAEFERLNRKINRVCLVRNIPSNERREFTYEEIAIDLNQPYYCQLKQFFNGNLYKLDNYLRFKISQVRGENGKLTQIITDQRYYLGQIGDVENSDEEESTF